MAVRGSVGVWVQDVEKGSGPLSVQHEAGGSAASAFGSVGRPVALAGTG